MAQFTVDFCESVDKLPRRVLSGQVRFSLHFTTERVHFTERELLRTKNTTGHPTYIVCSILQY